MNKLKKRKKSGFTLIEMVVVIAIVVIVAAIAIPQALKAVNKAKASTDVSNARIYAGQIMNRIANGEIPMPKVNVTDEAITKTLVGSDIVESKLEKEGTFVYSYDVTSDSITVSIKPKTGNAVVIYPKPAASSQWDSYVSK